MGCSLLETAKSGQDLPPLPCHSGAEGEEPSGTSCSRNQICCYHVGWGGGGGVISSVASIFVSLQVIDENAVCQLLLHGC